MRYLLQLEFRSRAVYRYFGVPAAVHEALLAAPSKGTYFNRAIRGRYAYVRVPEMQAAQTGAEVPPQREQGGGGTRGESAASIQNGHVRASIFGLVGSSVNLGGDLMSNENREFLEKLKFELAFIEDGGCRSRR